MKRPKSTQIYEGPNGQYSNRFIPTHGFKGAYLQFCCDCGLAHDKQFAVYAVVRRKGKRVGYKRKPLKDFIVMLRVRRNKTETKVRRRRKKFDAIRKVLP